MTLAEQVDTKIGEVIGLAITMPAPDALKVYRRLREASEELLHLIASGHMAAVETPKPEVVPIRPGIKTVGLKAAADMLGMKRTALYQRAEQPAFKAMQFNNGTNKRVFLVDKIEEFIRRRQG